MRVAYKKIEQENNWFCFVVKKGSDPKHDDKDSMLVDIGATCHIVNEDRNFKSFNDTFNPENHLIELAD